MTLENHVKGIKDRMGITSTMDTVKLDSGEATLRLWEICLYLASRLMRTELSLECAIKHLEESSKKVHEDGLEEGVHILRPSELK